MELVDIMAPAFTVYNYDRRGRGDSGDTAPYEVARELDDLDALIAEAGGSAGVYGVSSGGVLALEAAARGSAISKLAVFEPPVDEQGEPAPPEDDPMAEVAELIRAGRRGDAVERFVSAIGLPPEAVAEMRASPMWPRWEAMAHTLLYEGKVTGDWPGLAQRLGSMTVPTLVIGSGGSSPYFLQAARAVVDALPDGKLRVIEGQHHDVAAADLAGVLTEFFAA